MKNEIEIWKSVLGYEDYYMVSNFGKVKSLEKIIPHNIKNCNQVLKERILKTPINENGYPIVSLHNEGKSSTKKVHRLVAEAFLLNPENKPEVNHINGIKSDNRLINLEWNTKSENMKHAYMIGLNYVSECTTKKLLEANSRKVIDVKTGIIYNSIKEAAKSIGLSRDYLGRMMSGTKNNNTSIVYLETIKNK